MSTQGGKREAEAELGIYRKRREKIMRPQLLSMAGYGCGQKAAAPQGTQQIICVLLLRTGKIHLLFMTHRALLTSVSRNLRVIIHSEAGEGESVFWFKLPCQRLISAPLSKGTAHQLLHLSHRAMTF